MPNEKYNTGSSASTSVIIKVAGIDRVFFFFYCFFFFPLLDVKTNVKSLVTFFRRFFSPSSLCSTQSRSFLTVSSP